MSQRPSGIGSLARYENFEQVGEGTYGYVYHARDRRSGDSVALKRLIFHKEGAGFPLSAVREIKFLKTLQHQNIVLLKDIVTSKGCEHIELPVNPDAPRAVGGNSKKIPEVEGIDMKRCGNFYLVFEYVQHDLGGLIDAKYPFSLPQMKCIMRQLFEVLEYLHEQNVYHRDIKSSNILISSRLQVKLADFGLARSVAQADTRYLPASKQDLTNNVITLWYRPPELLLGQLRYSGVIDVWSAGCVLAEMCLHRPLFPGKTEAEQMDLIMRAVGTPTEDNWPGVSLLPNYIPLVASQPRNNCSFREVYGEKIVDPVMSLLDRLLVSDPNKRVTAKSAQLTSFFVSTPADNVPLDIMIEESLHEFQTKKKRRDSEKLKLAASKRRQVEVVDDIPVSAGTNEMRSSSGYVSDAPVPLQHQPNQQRHVYGYYENNWYAAAMQQQQHYFQLPEVSSQAEVDGSAEASIPECDDFSSFTTVQMRNKLS